MKKKFKISDNMGCVVWVLIILIVFGVCFGLTYLIAESNLPEWVKFWLLR